MNRERDEQLIEADESGNIGTLKSAHTKNPTTCADVRRNREACGICGSQNTVYQGVRFCNTCGREEESLEEEIYDFRPWHRTESSLCDCPDIKETMGYMRTYKRSPRGSYHVLKCIDCGAVKTNRFCPNCRETNAKRFRYFSLNGAWAHWDGRIYCLQCGFRSQPVSCAISSNNKKRGLGGKKADRLTAKAKSKKHFSRRQMKRLAAKHRPHPNKIG